MPNRREVKNIHLAYGRRGGQTILETAILLVAIVLAFVTMQAYLRRGLQGRLRQDIASIGEQYDPHATVSDITIRHASNMSSTTKTLDEEIVNPYSGEIENRLMTTVFSQTHYDNSSRSGMESIGGFMGSD